MPSRIERTPASRSEEKDGCRTSVWAMAGASSTAPAAVRSTRVTNSGGDQWPRQARPPPGVSSASARTVWAALLPGGTARAVTRGGAPAPVVAAGVAAGAAPVVAPGWCARRLRWLTGTIFGRPVDPDVARYSAGGGPAGASAEGTSGERTSARGTSAGGPSGDSSGRWVNGGSRKWRVPCSTPWPAGPPSVPGPSLIHSRTGRVRTIRCRSSSPAPAGTTTGVTPAKCAPR